MCVHGRGFTVYTKVKPLYIIAVCVVFSQVSFMTYISEKLFIYTVYNSMEYIVPESVSSFVSHSEFLVLTHSIPRIIISDINVAEVMCDIFGTYSSWNLLLTYEILSR